MKYFDAKLSQSSGEITPLLSGRSDLVAYQNGAKEVTNFLITPQGVMINRPGTKFLADGLLNARLLPFIVNTDLAWCCVMKTDGTASMYLHDGFVANVSGTHPYTADELKDLRYLQSIDRMFLFHNAHAPMQLVRHAINSWRFEILEIKNGPYDDYNTDNNKFMFIYREIEEYDDNGDTKFRDHFLMGASFFAFSPPDDYIGRKIKLEFAIPARSVDIALPHSDPISGEQITSYDFDFYGPSTIESHGVCHGKVDLYRKGIDDPDWICIKSWESNPSGDDTWNFGISWEEEEYGALYRIKVFGQWAFRLRHESATATRQVEIIEPINDFEYAKPTDTRVNIKPIDNIPLFSVVHDLELSAGTIFWAFGSWNNKNGYPAVAAFHQERLILANSYKYPTTIWMSHPADWSDFGTSVTTLDTDAITIMLATKQMDEIVAMSSRENLHILTKGAEFIASAGSRSDVFTPSSLVIVPTGYRGAYFIDVLDVGATILFVEKHGNVIRGLGYRLDIDGFTSSELSVMSEHFFEKNKVKRWCYQQNPWSIVWIATENGLLAYTFHEEHQVSSWTKQVIAEGSVNDIISIPDSDFMQDSLFLLVNDRLMWMYPRLDAGETQISPAMYKDEYNRNNPVTYKSSYESLEFEQTQAQGTIQGRFKQIAQITMRLYRTCGLKAGIITENSNRLDEVVFPDQIGPGYKTAPWSGDIYLEVPGGKGRTCRLRIENENPTPISILGIWSSVDIME